MFPRKFLFFVCLLCFAGYSLSAKTDTLDNISQRLKGDTTQFLNIFRKFNWDISVKGKDGKTQHYVSAIPDSLLKADEFDTVCFSDSIYVTPLLVSKILSLHYNIEGSVLIQLNKQTILRTGVFQPNHADELRVLFQDDYRDFIFTDSIQKLEITYVPYPKTKIFNLHLRIFPKQLAEEKIQENAKDTIESYGMGFYYLAFGIVFMILFIFFREKTENLYFSLFCLFAALAFLWDNFKTDILYNLDSFLAIISIEFLSIFFCKVLKNKEKSKVPLVVIACIMASCFLPFIHYNYVYLFGRNIPGLMTLIKMILYCYVWFTCLYFLVQGIGQKRWEARAVLIICFIPAAAFILLVIVFIVAAAVKGADNSGVALYFLQLFGYFGNSIMYVYPLAAVFILARRNGLNQKQLVAQVLSIQQLSDENLAKEKEKKHILENQKESLEKEVSQRTMEIVAQKEEIEKQHGELKVEKKKSDDLLLNILPEEVAEELKEKGFSEARLFDNVTVLFADFVDFTKAGEAMTPQELVSELHICFKTFDEIISKYNIEKIKTIGDAYLAVCGLPLADGKHAENVVAASLEISKFMQQRQAQLGDKTFRVRIGIHSGSVVAGIVGVKKFAYDIWGDTVNTAARMEQSSTADKINISQTTYDLVKDKFTCTYRGEIIAKNKGELKMYFVES